ncbi:MAG: HDOD domain-containing protein [Rhodocyclaceae bacterium]|nr:HDOD domain-containing protein [Rhodocyclaceae bacterium]
MLAPGDALRGVDQWAVFLKDQDIPIMPGSRMILLAMSEGQIDSISPKELARVVVGDPFLSVRLIRNAELRRSRRLGRESTTPLAMIMQTGLDGLLALVKDSPVCDIGDRGLGECAFKSATASYLARRWAQSHTDAAPEEIAMAALLADIGEMTLWHFAPEIPTAVQEELHSGRSLRVLEAQQKVAGFSFKDLSLALAAAWELPPLIATLIRGLDNARANIARIANDTARHIHIHPENPAIPADIIALKEYLPSVGFNILLAPLPVSDEFRDTVRRAVTREIE